MFQTVPDYDWCSQEEHLHLFLNWSHFRAVSVTYIFIFVLSLLSVIMTSQCVFWNVWCSSFLCSQVLDGLLAQCGTVENCEQGKTLGLKNWLTFEIPEAIRLVISRSVRGCFRLQLILCGPCVFSAFKPLNCFLVLCSMFLFCVNGWIFVHVLMKQFEKIWMKQS